MANVLDRIMDGVKTREGKVVAVLLTVSLSLMAWNVTAITAFADEVKDEPPADIVEIQPTSDDGDNPLDTQADGSDLVQPTQPNVEGLAASDANAAIANYNSEVDAYNAAAAQENANRQAQYDQDVAAAEAHNAAEDAKVAQNQEDLAKQAQREAKAELYESRGITENRTTDASEIPTYYPDEASTETKTIIHEVSENQSGKKVNVINIHAYVDENFDDWNYIQPTIDMATDKFVYCQELLDHLVLAEWESIVADENDTVTLRNEAKPLGFKSMAFYRYLPGYTNGYWIGSSIFMSTVANYEYGWDAGETHTFTYANGTTRNHPVEDVFCMYLYQFYRYGAEPEKVEAYTPNYVNAPEAPVFYTMLEHLPFLDVTPTPAPVPGTDPEPTPAPVDTPSTTPEPTETPAATPTEATTPVASIALQVTPAATPAAAVPAVAAAIPTVAAVAAAPAAVAPATQAAAPTTVADNPTPLASGETIEDDANALASGQLGSWSLFDLVCTVVTALISIILLVGVFGRSRKDEDDEAEANAAYASEQEEAKRIKRRRALRVASLVPAIGAIVLLLLTQDFTQPMAIFDRWSLVFGIVGIVQVVVAILSHKKKQDEDSDGQQQGYAPATA